MTFTGVDSDRRVRDPNSTLQFVTQKIAISFNGIGRRETTGLLISYRWSSIMRFTFDRYWEQFEGLCINLVILLNWFSVKSIGLELSM
ncbi:hypothetical protein L2E82_50351 [Cichorium intybus]|nr:hypothetical protein L2E82_50351 [Cichorium intybus]